MKKSLKNITENLPLLVIGIVALIALILVVKSSENKVTGNSVVGCFDSDSQEDFFTKGYVEYGEDRLYDYCAGKKLFQYYCKSSVRTGRIHGYDCPNGCNDGKCLSAQENCGNGVVDLGERCDDGNNLDGDGCSEICAIETGFSCNPISVCIQN